MMTVTVMTMMSMMSVVPAAHLLRGKPTGLLLRGHRALDIHVSR
ncbi:hypothetical protein [Bradyrhizobium aeschynomenes]